MTTGLINFIANGTVTVNTQSNITSVGTLAQLTVAGNSNLGAVGNVHITGGSANYVLTTDGAGNLSWTVGGGGGGGTVTSVDTSGSGLGFTLTGGPITTTGTVALTVPNATSLRSNLSIGNVANLNLNGNANTYLDGSGSFTIPPGSYSNSNVANYLPTYTGNLSAGNANINGTLTAITGNITGNLSTNNITVTNLLNGNVGNFLGNISSLNANLGNLAKANYLQGDGSLITNLPIPNYANFAGTLINGNSNVRIQANGNISVSVAGNSNVITFTGTGANIAGTFNASGNLSAGNAELGNLANANYLQGTLTTAAQPNITSVGTLSSLTVSGNVSTGNLNGGNLISANYYSGNGYLLTGITAVNANYSNFAGNIVNASQPNITAVGTLTNLGVAGNLDVLGNVSLTGTNISLGTVSNVHITGGNNGYYLQTDGTGNMSWVAGGGSGNGVVGGSNTQVQFNDAGTFGGNANLTFNKTTGITTGNFENIFRGLVKNKGQVINSNGNSIINFNVLDGPVLINTGGFALVANSANITVNAYMALNFVGNSTTSLNDILNVGDSINLKYIQQISLTSNSSRTANVNYYLGNASAWNQIDGTDINTDSFGTLQWINGQSRTGNIIYDQFVSYSQLTMNVTNTTFPTRYGILMYNIEIMKLSSSPAYSISITNVNP